MDYVSNDAYEQQDAQNSDYLDTDKEADETRKEEKPARAMFAFWDVRGSQYKLKLTPDGIMELENVYKKNLMNLMGDMDNLPSLSAMLQITHAAMKKWNHGIKLQKVKELYRQYIEDGGSQLQFYVEVFMKIYAVSGFFSTSMVTELTETVENMADNM